MALDTDHVTFIAALAERHQERLATALVTLENRIADFMTSAPLDDGELFDEQWAISARGELRTIIEQEYLVEVDAIIRDYDTALRDSVALNSTLSNFVELDPAVVSQLKSLSFQGFQDIGNEYLDVLAKEIYEATLVGASFATIVASVRGQVGGRLARYSRQLVHDSLMQFDASVNIKMAKDAGITKFKYVGSLVEESRDHCIKHRNKIYTEEQIYEIWSGSWAGKAEGNPFKVRGGYNCGHQFIGVE